MRREAREIGGVGERRWGGGWKEMREGGRRWSRGGQKEMVEGRVGGHEGGVGVGDGKGWVEGDEGGKGVENGMTVAWK